MRYVYLFFLLLSDLAHAGASYGKNEYHKISWTIDVEVTRSHHRAVIDEGWLRKRILEGKPGQPVEPVTIFARSDKALSDIVRSISWPGMADRLLVRLRRQSGPSYQITKETLDLVSVPKLQRHLSKKFYRLGLDTSQITTLKQKLDLIRQISDYIDNRALAGVYSRIVKGDFISIEDELLPGFAQERVGTFGYFRGLNCFHSVLAFQNENLPRLSWVNLRQENGHHPEMINHNELIRFLSMHFSLLPPGVPLEYGDVIVMLDQPGDGAVSKLGEVDHRWIKHAATYILGGYVFSKGSKSSNTHYQLISLKDEWTFWGSRSKNLVVLLLRKKKSRFVQSLAPRESWLR